MKPLCWGVFEIEATYMVPPGSPITSIDQVDRKGVKVVTSARSAYGLWLENNIKNAELIQIAGRPARSGRGQITWHLPEAWPWQAAWHGAFEATMHLVDRGHRAIAMVDGPPGSGTSRRNGYLRALAATGIEPVPSWICW